MKVTVREAEAVNIYPSLTDKNLAERMAHAFNDALDQQVAIQKLDAPVPSSSR